MHFAALKSKYPVEYECIKNELTGRQAHVDGGVCPTATAA